MANIKLIKRRIKSAQNISQITRAMQMVAASKMKKAQEDAQTGKPYTQKIYEVVSHLAALNASTKRDTHVLLSGGNTQADLLVILVSTNKGLCGGLNTNLFRAVTTWKESTRKNIAYVSVGKKGESFAVRSRASLVADFSQNVPFTQSVPALTKFAVEGFTNGSYSEVYVVFNNFVNALKHEPTVKRILPITSIEHGFDQHTSEIDKNKTYSGDFLFEPNRNEILNSLLPHYLENQIRAAILEAQASEHSARMIAMKNATEAALDLVEGLTLSYNKVRQEKITSEIADIVTAREALQ